jgi:hypothetical protein
VPDVLVSLHVLGATSVVVAMAALWTSCRVRDELPALTVGTARPLISAGATQAHSGSRSGFVAGDS